MLAADNRKISIPGGFGAGVGASLAMMLVMAVLRFTTNTPSIPELMEETLIRLTGGKIESFFINMLGVGGKALLLVCIVEGTLLLGGVLGLIFARFWPANRQIAGWRPQSGLIYGLLVGLFLNAVFLPLVGQGFFGSSALQVTAPPGIAEAIYGTSLAPIGIPVPIEMFLLSIIFGLTLVALLPWNRAVSGSFTAESSEFAPVAQSPDAIGRRDFTKTLAGGALALVGGVALWYAIRTALTPPPIAQPQLVEGDQAAATPDAGASPTTAAAAGQPTEAPAQASSTPGNGAAEATPASTAQTTAISESATPTMVPSTPPPTGPTTLPAFAGVQPMLVPEVTPVDTFYITTKNFIDPTVDGNAWKLSFKGMVNNPYSITLNELKALPSENRVETLACISNSVGGPLIGNANWKGVNFANLLKKAGVQKGAVDVVVRGADGYADSFPLDAALNNECVLVYEMNGQPLTQKHGYPARLLVPGIYGMKNCKWITDVELVNYDFKGYWESQGWSDTALYQTMSRIDFPNQSNIAAKPLYVGGVAFAGNRGIKRVEVSTDGGKTWNDAQLRPPMGKYTWVLWTYPWIPSNGVYTLKVRATDGNGAVQTANEQDTYPDGATGYHTVNVRVG